MCMFQCCNVHAPPAGLPLTLCSCECSVVSLATTDPLSLTHPYTFVFFCPRAFTQHISATHIDVSNGKSTTLLTVIVLCVWAK
jgi:hypothetical protein